LVVGVIDLEADCAVAQPDGLCCAEEAGGFAVTAGLAAQSAQAFQDVGDKQVRLDLGTFRKAAEDVELDGVRVPAGTNVIINTAAANRDPAVYDDPDRLDITRKGLATMLTFGGGIHYCLGAHLARAELTEALTVITRRMPTPRRSGPAPWKPLIGITGPATLPIEFDPGH
jgi:hypothetical protein